MNKSDKEVTPKLRFQSFRDFPKWKIKKLENFVEPIRRRAGTEKHLLMSVTAGVGLIPQAEKFGREIAGDAYKNYFVIQKYDFAYNKSATKQFPEGYIAMLKDYDDAAVPNSIFTCFRVSNSECDPIFFDQLFQANHHGKWLRRYIEVGGRAHGALSIDTKHLWSMPIASPSRAEQQKIAACLSSIDRLISAEEKKLSLLNDYKKSWMQKLFPAEGESIPTWRFPEFSQDGSWKRTLLSKVTTYVDYRGKTPRKTQKGIFLITAKNIKMGYIDYDSSREYVPKENYYAIMSRGLPKIGDVLITTEAPCGNIAQIDRTDVAIAQRIIKYRGIDGTINNTFLKYIFLSPVFQNELHKKMVGGVVKGIKGSVLHKMLIAFPDNLLEQKKIADFFSEIDHLIYTQVNKISRLRNQKISLVQGLFPSMEEIEK